MIHNLLHTRNTNMILPVFRWAWQNPHLSLKIPSDQRMKGGTRRTRSGRMKSCPPLPSLLQKLESLHLLLRVDAFSRWPLSLRFFSQDVYDAWNRWCERESTSLRKIIKVVFDPRLKEDGDDRANEKRAREENESEEDRLSPSCHVPMGKKKRKTRWGVHGEGGVQGLDISNDHLNLHLQKSRDILRPDVDLECNICHGSLAKDHVFTVICPHSFCEHIAHMVCLASVFLQQEKRIISTAGDGLQLHVLPTNGECPGCKRETLWVDLVKELSVRVRSKLKSKAAAGRKRAGKGAVALDDSEEEEDDGGESGNDEGDITAADLAELPKGLEGEQWEDHDTDIGSVLSDVGSETEGVKGGKVGKGKGKVKRRETLPVLVEDSDLDSILGGFDSETGSVKSGRSKRKGSGKATGEKELPVVAEGSDICPVLSDSGSDTRSVEGRSKTTKGSKKTQGEKLLPAAERSDVDLDVRSEMGSKARKGRGKTRGKKALPVVEESDADPDSGHEAGSKTTKGRRKAKGKQALPVVIADSDWDNVDTVV